MFATQKRREGIAGDADGQGGALWLLSVLTAAKGKEGRLGRPHSSTAMPIAAVGWKPASRLVEEGTG